MRAGGSADGAHLAGWTTGDRLLSAAANKHAGGNGRVPLDVVKCGGGAAILFGELEAAQA